MSSSVLFIFPSKMPDEVRDAISREYTCLLNVERRTLRSPPVVKLRSGHAGNEDGDTGLGQSEYCCIGCSHRLMMVLVER